MTAMRYVSFRFFASYTPFQRTSLSTKLASASTRIWRLLPLDKACPYSLADCRRQCNECWQLDCNSRMLRFFGIVDENQHIPTNNMSQDVKLTYVVVDTNIWVYGTRMLTTASGAALLYSVRRTNSKIGLPEVIEREIRKHTTRIVSDAIRDIHECYRLIEMVMGRRDDYRVPADDDIANRVDERLAELSDLLHRVPFTFDAAQGALERILSETPPNGQKNQRLITSSIDKQRVEF